MPKATQSREAKMNATKKDEQPDGKVVNNASNTTETNSQPENGKDKELSKPSKTKRALPRSESEGRSQSQDDEAPQAKRAKNIGKEKSTIHSPQEETQIADGDDGEQVALRLAAEQGSDGKGDYLKVVTWNVNGLRSVLAPSPSGGKKGPLIEYVRQEEPDIIFLNEVKLNDKIKNDYEGILEGYKGKVYIAEKNGYAGVAVYWRADKVSPQKVECGIGQPQHDKDGRTIILELEDLILVGSYVPNAGRGLVNLNYRVQDYDPAMRQWLFDKSKTPISGSESKDDETPNYKDVVWCGDLNVAHTAMDIWNSKGNKKSAGHTPEERESFSMLLEQNDSYFKDVYRQLYPDKIEYTFWAATSPSGFAENKGWRLDYFIAGKEAFNRCKDVIIQRDVRGSDHCPVALLISKTKLC